jgi:hypothetical protein
MKKVLLYTLTIAGTLGVAAMTMTGVAAHSGPDRTRATIHADAAFRDGVYLGKLDAETGRRPHLTSGRWSSSLDRASFIAGYQSTYVQRGRVDAASEQLNPEHTAELAGFQDGMADGTLHRQQSLPFQLVKTENYRRANGYSDNAGDPDNYRRFYRDAYTTGYQQAYYGVADPNLLLGPQ